MRCAPVAEIVAARPATQRHQRVRATTVSRLLRLCLSTYLVAGCATGGQPVQPPEAEPPAEPTVQPGAPAAELALYRAATDRMHLLEEVNENYRQRYGEAELSIASLEKALPAGLGRADAVAYIAAATLRIRQASDSLDGAPGALSDAEVRLGRAESHLNNGNFGAAIFFALRASRLAETAEAEHRRMMEAEDVYLVNVEKANLRRDPSVGSEVIAVLTEHTPVHVHQRSGGWVLCRTASDSVGWISERLLDRR